MSLQSRREYLDKIRGRYTRAGRAHKSRILDEFSCGYDRKHAIRLLTQTPQAKGRAGRPRRYGEATVSLLKEFWLASDQMCSKRLQAAAADWLGYFRAPLSAKTELRAMSPATMDRLLAPWRARLGRKRRSGTRPGSLLKKQIPIRTAHTAISGPGYLEADTVAHCGGSLSGDFIWTLTFTDVHSGWTQCRAVWNKGHTAIHQHLDAAERDSPFPWKGFDCDNGSEFLNHALWDHYRKRPQPVNFTRSRPNHKNDNAHVEQKNWSAVRQLLGYDRLESPEIVPVLNDLYENEWHWLVNFFSPTFKLKEKKRIGSKYVKRYEQPRTPYARLLEAGEVSAAEKEKLRAVRSGLNPLKLRQRVEQKLRLIFELQKRTRQDSDRRSASCGLATRSGYGLTR